MHMLMTRSRMMVLVIGVCLVSALLPAAKSSATGPYVMSVMPASTTVEVGSTVTVGAAIDTNGQPPYAGAQWYVEYDQSVLQFVSAATHDANVPAACNLKQDDGDRTLLACARLTGPDLSYSGVAWDVTYTCIAPGSSPLTLVVNSDSDSATVVLDDTVTIQPMTTTDATVTCVTPADADADGLPDSYELAHACLDMNVPDATADPDGDGATNAAERVTGTDPCSPDTDGDGLPDGYEPAHSCLDVLVNDSDNDPDSDGATSLQEFQNGHDPCASNGTVVSLVPYGLSVVPATSNGAVGRTVTVGINIDATNAPRYSGVQWFVDYDQATLQFVRAATHTGTSNCDFQNDNGDRTMLGCLDLTGANLRYSGTAYDVTYKCLTTGVATIVLANSSGPSPDTLVFIGQTTQPVTTQDATISCATDADGDGMSDDYEQQHSCLNPAANDAAVDFDGDGLSNVTEFTANSNACAADSDGDGVPDGMEMHHGTALMVANPDPANPDDDGDGCPDASEASADPVRGGARDGMNRWDFFDVTGDHSIDLSDTVDVLRHFSESDADPATHLRDRQIADPNEPWRTSEANDGVDLTDAVNSLASFADSCGG